MTEQPNSRDQELEQVRQQLAKTQWQSRQLRMKLEQSQKDLNDLLARLSAEAVERVSNGEKHATDGVNPENLIWIFGDRRSGSTWLKDMMQEPGEHQSWDEPLVGRLFGEIYYKTSENNLTRADFIMGAPTRSGWINSIRNFTLDGARYVHPNLGPENYLVIQEPNGSVGAPLLMEALPESRMIFLVRDPRDVVASTLKRNQKGGNQYLRRLRDAVKRQKIADNKADSRPDEFVKGRAATYLRNVGSAKEAYETHEGRKTLVKYEDLRYDTLKTMHRIYATLEIPIDDEELRAAVEKHAWENVPAVGKGVNTRYRKATPGGWKDDLTSKQVEIVEQITAPLLKEFYPA